MGFLLCTVVTVNKWFDYDKNIYTVKSIVEHKNVIFRESEVSLENKCYIVEVETKVVKKVLNQEQSRQSETENY